jgi:hypothetical protein
MFLTSNMNMETDFPARLNAVINQTALWNFDAFKIHVACKNSTSFLEAWVMSEKNGISIGTYKNWRLLWIKYDEMFGKLTKHSA